MEDKKVLNNEAAKELPEEELENVTGGAAGLYTKVKRFYEILFPNKIDDKILNPQYETDIPIGNDLDFFDASKPDDSDNG